MITIMNTLFSKSFFGTFAEYALYIYFALFPFINFQSFLFGGTSTRVTSLILLTMVLGVLCAIFLFKESISFSISKSYITLFLLLYLVSLFISGIVGLNFDTSFWSVVTRMTGIWYLINLGFFVFFISGVMADRIKGKRLILSIVLPMVLYSVLSLLGPEGLGWIFKGYQGDGFTFGNSTFAGMYIFGAFLLSVYYVYQAAQKKWWMYVLPVLLVVNPNILSRIVWFGDFSHGFVGEARASSYVIVLSVFALLALWGISKIQAQKTKKVVVYSLSGLLLLVAFCSTFSLFSSDGVLRKVYLSQATAARPLVWEMSEKSIRQRPFFGWGTDNFERVFEINYDNRLLETENGKEAWFDRAHNVFIDQAVDNGIVGLVFYVLAYLVIVFSVIRTFVYSLEKNDVFFASVLLVYFPLHFVELQTAFDTAISYPMLAFMIAAALVLNSRTTTLPVVKGMPTKKTEWFIGRKLKCSFAVLFLVFFLWSFFAGWLPFVEAQIANGYVRTVGISEKRILVYKDLFGSKIDSRAFLWRTTTDFQRGIAENQKILEQPQRVEGLEKEIVVLEKTYRDYLENNPESFRERLNLADILIYQRLFGVDKLAEAQTILDESIALVPQSPQPYWMKAVGYIYMKKFELAREYAKKGLAVNSKIEESQNIVAYVEDSIKNFPDINLYFFTQI